VDDASPGNWTGAALEAVVKDIPKTRIIRLKTRAGLIRAKVRL